MFVDEKQDTSQITTNKQTLWSKLKKVFSSKIKPQISITVDNIPTASDAKVQ